MQQNRRHMVHAFTLTEVMITMVVSSLVILLAYSALQMMNHYFLRTGQSNEINSERLSMRTILAKDIDASDSILYEDDLLTMYNNGEILTWISDSTVLLRSTGIEEEMGIKIFRVGRNRLFTGEAPSTGLVGMVGVGLAGEAGDSAFFRFFKKYGLEMDVNRPSVVIDD